MLLSRRQMLSLIQLVFAVDLLSLSRVEKAQSKPLQTGLLCCEDGAILSQENGGTIRVESNGRR